MGIVIISWNILSVTALVVFFCSVKHTPATSRAKEQGARRHEAASCAFFQRLICCYILATQMPDSKIRLRWVPRFWQVLHCWLARWPGRRCVSMGFFFWNARAWRVTWDACSSLNSSPNFTPEEAIVLCLNGAPELLQRDALLGQHQAYNGRRCCIWQMYAVYIYDIIIWLYIYISIIHAVYLTILTHLDTRFGKHLEGCRFHEYPEHTAG